MTNKVVDRKADRFSQLFTYIHVFENPARDQSFFYTLAKLGSHFDSNSSPNYPDFKFIYSSRGATGPICRRSCERMKREYYCRAVVRNLFQCAATHFCSSGFSGERLACLFFFGNPRYPISENLISGILKTLKVQLNLKV